MINQILDNPISKVANTLFWSRYNFELMRIKLKSRFNANNEASFEYLYGKYLKQVLTKEASPYGYLRLNQKSEDIFKDFWKDRKKEPTLREEQYLITLLENRCGKWFVPCAFKHANSFSQNMMKALLDRAIRIGDPDRIKYLISPAERIHGKQTSDYLVERFKVGDFKTQRGILRMHYHINNAENNNDWLKLFLDQYLMTNNNKLKTYLSYNLPKTINEFPIALKSKAVVYLNEIERLK